MTALPNETYLLDILRTAGGLPAMNGDGRALADAAQTWAAATGQYQQELLGFLTRRLEKDGETMRELMACRNMVDFTAAQSRWLQDAFRDYNGEMIRMLGLYARLGNAGNTGEAA